MKLTDTLGNEYNITLPEDIEAVSLAQGLGYQLEMKNIDDWLQKKIKDETLDQDRNYYLYMLARAVSLFVGIDLNKALNWNAEDLVDDQGNVFDSVLQAHLQEEPVEKTEGIENLLLYLSGRINELLKRYKFKVTEGDYRFDFDGEEYRIPNLAKALLLGKKVFDKITVGQAVDVMKIKKYISTVEGFQENIDNKKNVTFTSYIQIIAILALKVGEEYPDSPEAAAAYVQAQAVKFQKIDYSTANDVVFFLTTFGNSSKPTQITSIISTLHTMRLVMNNAVGTRTLGSAAATMQ